MDCAPSAPITIFALNSIAFFDFKSVPFTPVTKPFSCMMSVTANSSIACAYFLAVPNTRLSKNILLHTTPSTRFPSLLNGICTTSFFGEEKITPCVFPCGSFLTSPSRTRSRSTDIDLPEIASPQILSRGYLDFSSSRTLKPCFPRSAAQLLPPVPPPTTIASKESVSIGKKCHGNKFKQNYSARFLHGASLLLVLLDCFCGVGLKFSYCPQCVSLDMNVSNGMQVCAKCGYSGPMNYDSMDVINAAKRSKSRQSSSD